MNQEDIKKYIETYKNSYSKEQIIAGLRQQGVSDNEINQAYFSLENVNNNDNNKKKNNKVLFIVIILIVFFIVIPIILVIVGSLIFSFVNFDTVLSNQLDLSNDLRGEPSQLALSSSKNTIAFIFTYVGVRAQEINSSGIFFKSDSGWTCDSSVGVIEVQNIDTARKAFSTENEFVRYINGQTGMIVLKCPEGSLVEGEQVEGDIEIPIVDTRDNLTLFSMGRMRGMVD